MQDGQDTQSNFIRGVFVNRALRVKRFHQSDGSERQADALPQDAAVQFIQLEAAAAEIENKARRIEIAKRAEDRDTHEARFFIAGDNLQIDFGLMADAFEQNVAVTSLARGAGRHGSIRGDAARVHDAAEFAEGRGRLAQCFAIEFPGSKNRMAEAHGSPDRLYNFPIIGGANSRDHQAERVGPGVDRRDLDGFAKS